MKTNILVVLGSPNSPSGNLSDISKSRLNYCKRVFTEGNLVLCTGGWGPHFNRSNSAHATHAKAYLIKQGLSEKDFLKSALSKNTVDDAVKVKSIVSNMENVTLTVISSDYHLDRVKLIFNTILGEHDIKYIGVESKLKKEEYNTLVQHEKEAIQSIMKNGLYY